jgi:hypothetical protein
MWERRRLLLWGKTYPELSVKHTETVCTGAVFLDQPGLVRIYPMPERYQPDGKRPHKWDVFSAEVRRNPSDPRPESYKIQPGSITVEGSFGTEHAWERRRNHLLRDEHFIEGLEDITQQQADSGRSLGIIRRTEILGIRLRKVSQQDHHDWMEKYEAIIKQQELWPPGRRPVPPPKVKPYLTFRAAGDSMEYERVVLDWEVHLLGYRHEQSGSPEADFRNAFMEKVAGPRMEPFLILGNIASHPQEFVVVAVLYPPRPDLPRTQLGLFGGEARG